MTVLDAPGVGLASGPLIALRRVALAAYANPPPAALPGGFATRRRGQGLEVVDVREYVPGDDLRALDRGATARTGRLHVRQFQEERDRVTLLVVDFRASMFWGLQRAFLSVAAAEALVMIGWHLVESGGRVALLAVTPGAPVVVPPRGRARGMLDVIGGLVQAHRTALADAAAQAKAPTLDQALIPAERLAPAGAEVVIASGFDAPGAGLRDRLDALDHRRNPRLVLVTEARTERMPRGWYPIRLSDGRRMRVHLAQGEGPEDALHRQVAARAALVVNASDSVEETARRISAAMPAGRAA